MFITDKLRRVECPYCHTNVDVMAVVDGRPDGIHPPFAPRYFERRTRDEVLLETISVNVDNEKLSDTEFRDFVRRSMVE